MLGLTVSAIALSVIMFVLSLANGRYEWATLNILLAIFLCVSRIMVLMEKKK